MQESTAWSVNLGRWGGVRVRLHAFFLLMGVFAVYLGTRTPDQEMAWYGLLTVAILLLSVLLHELAHCFVAFRLGGRADLIMIGPFGGLAPITIPHEPRFELYVAVAGPLVNASICTIVAPLLYFMGGVNVVGLLNPLIPDAIVEGPPPIVFLKLTFWLNWVLVLLNLLPAFPFDGGRVLRGMLRPVLGYRSSVSVVARIAWFSAMGLCVLAWVMRDVRATDKIPAWLPLVLIAMFLFFSANQEIARGEHSEADDDLLEYDFGQGYSNLDREADPPRTDDPGLLRRWLDKRREEKERQLREQEEAEECRVDEILARLHGTGMAGLSANDRALLQRVSARYRNRLKS